MSSRAAPQRAMGALLGPGPYTPSRGSHTTGRRRRRDRNRARHRVWHRHLRLHPAVHPRAHRPLLRALLLCLHRRRWPPPRPRPRPCRRLPTHHSCRLHQLGLLRAVRMQTKGRLRCTRAPSARRTRAFRRHTRHTPGRELPAHRRTRGARPRRKHSWVARPCMRSQGWRRRTRAAVATRRSRSHLDTGHMPLQAIAVGRRT